MCFLLLCLAEGMRVVPKEDLFFYLPRGRNEDVLLVLDTRRTLFQHLPTNSCSQISVALCVVAQEMRYFLTGSYAEFHDPYLRRLLVQYVRVCEGDRAAERVENDVTAWHSAVTRYKQVVTHFFAYKTEQWHNRFLRNTLGAEEYQGVYEFAKQRGAIHYHSNACTDGPLDEKLDLVLANLCVDINDLLLRQEKGIITQSVCDVEKDGLVSAAAVKLQEFNSFFLGMSAQHPGLSPSEWVRPAGVAGLGHRENSTQMLTKEAVRNKNVLRSFKFDHEGDLYQRLVDTVNTAFTHTCSDYCWKPTRMTAAYEVAKHGPRDDLLPHVVGFLPRDKDRVTVKVSECRMHYGYKLHYARHGCRTGGKAFQRKPSVTFDRNGVPRLHCSRNHPRVLQQCAHVYYWGANADMQRFLTNRKSRGVFEDRVNADGGTYEELTARMAKAKVGGLEQTSGCVHVNGYTTGYKCKKKGGSKDWEVQFLLIGEDLSDDRGNTPLRALVGKSMNAIAQCRDRSKDEASFMLSGGKLTFSTLPVKACSISHVSTEEIKEPKKHTWTYQSLKGKYEARALKVREESGMLNFFTWCAKHSTKATLPTNFAPRFMGLSVIHGVPVTEPFAEEQLQLFRPYWGKHAMRDEYTTWVEEFDAFIEETHIHHEHCPLALRHKIRMLKNDVKFVPADEAGADAQRFGLEGLPSGSDDRVLDGVNQGAVGVAEACGVVDPIAEEGDLAALEFTAEEVASFDNGSKVPVGAWSREYRQEGLTWVADVAKRYYSNLSTAEAETPTVLPSKPAALPRFAKGFSQQILVGLALHKLHALTLGKDDPFRYNVYVQGNPGSGKTFTMKVILNMYRAVLGKEGAARSIAPTGMAASLTGGTTMYRFANMPVGKSSFEMPYDMSGSKDVTKMEQIVSQMEALSALLGDETSMMGRPDIAWLNHRVSEGRRPAGSDGDGVLFGGVPLVMFFQDVMQLPPVAKKALSNSDAAANASGACHLGKLVFEDFLRPAFNSGDKALTVVMDAVFRQSDPAFTTMLQHMREGKMEKEDVDFIESRRMSKLSPAEQQEFWDHAVFLFPDWKRCKPVLVKYLRQIDNVLVVANGELSMSPKVSGSTKAKHRAELSLPEKNVLMEGAAGQLLSNLFVEGGLFNGATGTIKKIVYKEGESPHTPQSQIAYVELRVKGLKLPLGQAPWDASDPDVVPIPVTTCMCEKKCCHMKGIPIRVHKACTIHKGQGLTIGEGHMYSKVVVGLGGNCMQCGSEIVALSRAEKPEDFAVLEDVTFDRQYLFKIGTGLAYDKKREFELRLEYLQVRAV